MSGKRVDVVLVGRDLHGQPTALVVELKQWSDVTLDEEDGRNVLVGGAEHAHPSEQAVDYADYLSDIHGAFVDG